MSVASTAVIAREQGGGGAPADPHATFLATRTFGSLDGLRALSIIAVLWHHSGGERGAGLAGRGFLGVDLFFVISGFLIVTLLLRERRRSGNISLKAFYIRRALRIFPPYYLMLAVVTAATFLKPGNDSANVRADLPYALAYVANLVPMRSLLSITWSLATEEQFYLVVPTLERWARRAFPVLLPAAYVLVILPTFGLWPGLHLPEFVRQTTFGPILLGVGLAHALDRPAAFSAFWRLLGHRLSPIAALGVLGLALANPAADLSGWPRIAIHWGMALLVASCVVRERHVLAPALRLWPMRRIGIVSYGIYLYHMLVWYFVHRAMQRAGLRSEALFFVALSLGTWGVAELSFRLFESRVLALKERFSV